MEFSRTERGKAKLLLDGYAYVKQKDLADGKESWECELRRSRQCKAKVHILAGRVVHRTNEHTHVGDARRSEVIKFRAAVKERAQTTEETPQQILADSVQNLSDAASGSLPSLNDMRRGIRRNRQQVGNPLPIPGNAADFEIPREYQLTSRQGQFLLYDSGMGDANRILIFSSHEGINFLHNAPSWAADGTFKTVPEIFSQLYTLHGIAGSRVFPCVYALLPNKREETYQRLLTEMTNAAGNHNPRDILIDFERAAMNSLQAAFPDADIKGCFFHLAQSVYRQVRIWPEF